MIGRVVWACAALFVAAGIASYTAPSKAGIVLAGATLVALGLGLLVLVFAPGSTLGPGPSDFEQALEGEEPRPGRPEDLQRLERSLGWERYEARDFGVRVRPRVRELLAWRVKERRGIDLDAHPEVFEGLHPELRGLAPTRADVTEAAPPVRTEDIARLLDRIEDIS